MAAKPFAASQLGGEGGGSLAAGEDIPPALASGARNRGAGEWGWGPHSPLGIAPAMPYTNPEGRGV